MAVLSSAQRKAMDKKQFAVPSKAPESGSYPIPDRSHAQNALSRVSQNGTPAEKSQVRSAVAKKFGMGKKMSALKNKAKQYGASNE